MKEAIINRFETSDQGTFGDIVFGPHMLFTGELPDRGNAPSISCILAGSYECEWSYSPAFKRDMYLVKDVEGRSGIRFHPANYMGDRDLGFKCHLEGCVALGEKWGSIKGQKAILISRPAITTFQDYMGGDPFHLEIIDNV